MHNSDKRAKMYANIERHGARLNAIFNTGLEPVALCKKLRRLEKQAHDLALHYCNGTGGVTTENWEVKTAPVLAKVRKLLFPNGMTNTPLDWAIFINGDARGYALKIKSEYVEKHKLVIYEDFGGYGIIAPDFTE